MEAGLVGRTRTTMSNSHPKALVVTRDNVAETTARLPFPARQVVRQLVRIEHGALTLRLPDHTAYRFVAAGEGPDAELVLHNWRLPRRALLGGSIGVAESYMDGDWSSPDVTAFLVLFILNEQLYYAIATPNWLSNAIETVRHWLNQNTRRGSKRNIAAHYDLGNAFYSRWLDPSMTYSSAIYEPGANSLAAAQHAKYRSLAERTGMREGDRVLEIGCGWGGFAEFAAKEVGCNVTGLTISREQYDFARERMFRQGLNEKVEIRFQDYRDETGRYVRIASI